MSDVIETLREYLAEWKREPRDVLYCVTLRRRLEEQLKYYDEENPRQKKLELKP